MSKRPGMTDDRSARPRPLPRSEGANDGGKPPLNAASAAASDRLSSRRVSAYVFLCLLIVPALTTLSLGFLFLLRNLADILQAALLIEADSTGPAMEQIANGVQHARLLSCILWGLTLGFLALLAALFFHVLQPLRLASRNLRRIRHNRTPLPAPPTRIREVQDLHTLLSDLSDHLVRLTIHSGRLEAEKDRYVSLSMVDGLTGISNRRSFDVFLTSQDRRHDALAVLMIDVDLFKLYNDSLGHQEGDKALTAVAACMKQSLLRATDQIFRYGGEEFIVLLPNATEKSAMAVAARILLRVRQLHIPHPSSNVAPMVTVSIGLALRRQGETVDNAVLVTRADQALYHAKNSGRNRVCVYEPSIPAPDLPAPAPAPSDRP